MQRVQFRMYRFACRNAYAFDCCRYLAVRLGLNVAIVKDVFGQHERTAIDRLQPASLTQHYKFAAHARHLSDAHPEDADLVSSLV